MNDSSVYLYLSSTSHDRLFRDRQRAF